LQREQSEQRGVDRDGGRCSRSLGTAVDGAGDADVGEEGDHVEEHGEEADVGDDPVDGCEGPSEHPRRDDTVVRGGRRRCQ
jgi:hypothetical protein